jgi:hypothetical protein
MANKLYFIQCGNWAVKINNDPTKYDSLELLYTELATKSIEIIFGNGDFDNDNDDYYAIMNDNGINMLDSDELPIPTFTTKIHILSSYKNNPHKLLTSLRTSDIFANASQWENVKYALQAEQLEQ